MIGITDVIMSFLFFPVTLFILVPLIMLSGWALLKLTLPLFSKREEGGKKRRPDEVIILTR